MLARLFNLKEKVSLHAYLGVNAFSGVHVYLGPKSNFLKVWGFFGKNKVGKNRKFTGPVKNSSPWAGEEFQPMGG